MPLSSLSKPLLARIVEMGDLASVVTATALNGACGRAFHEAARSAVYRCLRLEDDDRILVNARALTDNEDWRSSDQGDASGTGSGDSSLQSSPGISRRSSGGESRTSSMLSTILSNQDYADEVRTLIIVDPLGGINSTAPLDDDDLVRLVERLEKLERLNWAASRPPPAALGSVLVDREQLTTFGLFLPQITTKEEIGGATPPSPETPFSPSSVSSVGIDAGVKPLRWDGDLLVQLPKSLANISIGDLSVEGARLFAKTACELPNLVNVTLERSLFVDDSLVAAIAHQCSRLISLRLRGITGTKLTDKGIIELFDASKSIEALELREVEGRLSKTLWEKVVFRSNFRALRVGYNEIGIGHSWVSDHLNSIESVLDLPTLRVLSVTRLVPLSALEPGHHNRVAISPVAQPQRIPTSLGQKLLDTVGRLQVLEIDWYETSFDFLKAMLEQGKALHRLQVLLDAPFTKALDITSNTPTLRCLVLSIPPRHTPGLEAIGTVFVHGAAPDAMPGVLQPTPGNTNPSPAKKSSALPATTPALAVMSNAIPPVKDIKRFLRKMPRLARIEWTGRGGVCSWTIERKSSSVLAVPKIEVTPIPELLAQSKVEATRRIGTLASTGIDLCAFAPRTTRRVRSQTQSSILTFESSAHSTSPPQTPNGLALEGLGFPDISEDAAFPPLDGSAWSQSHDRRASNASVTAASSAMGRRASVDTKSPQQGRRRMTSNSAASVSPITTAEAPLPPIGSKATRSRQASTPGESNTKTPSSQSNRRQSQSTTTNETASSSGSGKHGRRGSKAK